jgi:hypothetical protein
MIVEISEGTKPVIKDPSDLQSLEVSVTGPELASGTLLAALGAVAHRIDADHVWLSLDWLRENGGRNQPPEWFDRFDAMCAYARGKGWAEPESRSLRAHLERGDRA